ncbi:MAG: hypothetical protein MRK02_11855 [Candidatus Scalindua sp.]|nr:hypothetical protein [Candidatus Scalindua sp.]
MKKNVKAEDDESKREEEMAGFGVKKRKKAGFLYRVSRLLMRLKSKDY